MTPAALGRVREWFRSAARAYPWSETQDPYAIWISEIMLQQTVVTAAVAPYRAWMARWPDLKSLAEADVEAVLRAWEGLGYASRAKNLHRAARILVDQGATTLPNSEQALRALPGIGDYTAAALLSFAFHQPALTLDANLKRVFQRLDGDPEWTPAVEARWRHRWEALVDGPTSREANQAIMQLGQQLCRSQAPACPVCPLAEDCRAHQQGSTAQIPAPKVRQVEQKQTTVVLWRRSQGELWWLARPDSGRFSHLWLAPPLDDAEIRGFDPRARPLGLRVHTYTRYRDQVRPWVADWPEPGNPPLPLGWSGRWVTPGEARSLGMVSVYRKIWNEATELTLL